MTRSLRFSAGLGAIAGVVGIAGSAFLATAASAETISAELVITPFGSPTSTIALANQSSTPGQFAYNGGGAVGSGTYTAQINATASSVLGSPFLLDTDTLDTQLTGLPVGSTIALYITEQGLTNSPAGILSAFTVVGLGGGTYTPETYYDPSNGTFGGILLASAGPYTSAPPPSSTDVASTLTSSSSTYSLTAEYVGTTTATSGNIDAAIDLTATPLPATLPLLAGGLGLLGLLGRRKQRGIVAA